MSFPITPEQNSELVLSVNNLHELVSYRLRYGDIAPTQQSFDRHKDNYRRQRDAFRSDPRALPELHAWRRVKNDYNYPLLNHSGKAFIPAGLIGRGPPDYVEWEKADTFFSEYELHNPRSLILSETQHSYIIGNNASYDGRQYPLAPTDKRPEGQGYCHTLVIPKQRIYNAADPKATENDCFILKELRDHFIEFWSSDSNKHAILDRAEQVLWDRHNILIQSDQRPLEYTPAVARAVMDDFGLMKRDFLKLDAENFMFGFHVYPENSIGHLHMHVFPHNDTLRVVSTKTYDYKTVPLQAILDVEEEDRRMANGTVNGDGAGHGPLNGELPSSSGERPSSSGISSSTMDLIMMSDTPSEHSSNPGVSSGGPVQPPDTSPPGADQPPDISPPGVGQPMDTASDGVP
ncbi:MAG: hypothetical protein Q9226_001627 [Calogaya cf. arnoldii]